MKTKFFLTILIALTVGAGASRLQVTDDASAAMLPQNSEWQASYDQFLDDYPGDQTVSIILRDLICEPNGWSTLIELHDNIESKAYNTRVLSLAAYESKIVTHTADSISVDAIRNSPFSSNKERCEQVSNYSPYSEKLIAKDGTTTYLLVFADPAIDAVTLSAKLRKDVEPFRARIEELGGNLVVTGEPIMSAEIARLIEVDSNFIAITFLVMLVLVYVLTKSKAVIGVVLSLNAFVLAVTYGAMGWLSITLTPATSLVVFLLIPLSTAFVIHSVGYVSRSSSGPSEGSRIGFAIAAVSTGIGFAATGFTPAHDIQMMALMGVIGIAATTAGVFLFVLPVLEAKQTRVRLQFNPSGMTSALGNPAIGYTFLFLMLTYTMVGTSKLEFNYSPIANLPETNQTRVNYDKASEYFPRLSIPLVIREGVESVSTYQTLLGLEELLEKRYGSDLQIQSVVPHIQELSKAFADPVPATELPTSDEALAQYLLLLEPEDVSLYIDSERNSLVSYIQVPFDTSADYLELKPMILNYLRTHKLEGEFVGRVSAFFEAGHRVGVDTLRGLLVSSFLILLVLWFLYRSIPLAVAGILVNVIPIGAGLATLGFLGIPVEIGSAVVAAIAFGILLDDSMHLLVRVRNLVSMGYDPSTAVHAALNDLVTPIAASTITISVGYLVLFFANLNSFNDFALVISSTLVLALLSDILVLPILVRRFYRDPLG